MTLDVIDSVAVRPRAEDGGRGQRVDIVPPAVEPDARLDGHTWFEGPEQGLCFPPAGLHAAVDR